MKNFKYLLVAMFAAGALTACGTKEETPIVNEPVIEEEVVDGELDYTEEEYVEPEFNIEDVQVTVTGKLADAYLAIREAYGNSYLPNAEIPSEMLEEIYGIKAEQVAQIVAEQPMIGMHPDLFIGIEATEGNADAVEEALTAYQNYLINDSMQYPVNVAKVATCQVVRYDNFVFLVLLGAPNENMDATEEEAAAHAQAEAQKATDALNSIFNN